LRRWPRGVVSSCLLPPPRALNAMQGVLERMCPRRGVLHKPRSCRDRIRRGAPPCRAQGLCCVPLRAIILRAPPGSTARLNLAALACRYASMHRVRPNTFCRCLRAARDQKYAYSVFTHQLPGRGDDAESSLLAACAPSRLPARRRTRTCSTTNLQHAGRSAAVPGTSPLVISPRRLQKVRTSTHTSALRKLQRNRCSRRR